VSERLGGSVAVITGAASGMGATGAELFAAEGARVVAADLDAAGGEAVVARIREAGGEATFVHTDVSDPGDAKALIDAAREAYGVPDVLYNNAGIGPTEDAAVHELALEVWDRVMNVNVRGMFLVSQAAIAAMLDAGTSPASIVNTASIAGLVGNSRVPASAYTVSKGAVMALTKQIAVSYAANGIRCNAMCPGPIETPILAPWFEEEGVRERFEEHIPIGRIGQPSDVAKLALFLASDDSSWITGALIPIDGGILAG
jgi:NAD(P)-dependent dehydrogenase (short-subunit alcohol dehydrogenase family)